MNLAATINIRFRLKHDAVPQLHQSIGPDYISRMLRPEIGNRAREIIAEYSAEEVYSTKRQEIQKRIRTHTEAMLGQSMIQRTEKESEYGEHYRVSLDEMLILYDTLVLGLELPQTVVAAINRKVEQYYLVQEYAFRVDRERKELERKQIEAYGIRDFQQTVTQGISDSYVRWRGIEATLQLAQSPNTKIVIIGSGKDGLPVILGNVDTPIAPQPPPGGATPAPDNSEAAKQKPAAASPPSAGEDAGRQPADTCGAATLPTTGSPPPGSSGQPAAPGGQPPAGRARPAVVRAQSGPGFRVDADDLGGPGPDRARVARQCRDQPARGSNRPVPDRALRRDPCRQGLRLRDLAPHAEPHARRRSGRPPRILRRQVRPRVRISARRRRFRGEARARDFGTPAA